jgi:hypothetical protein
MSDDVFDGPDRLLYSLADIVQHQGCVGSRALAIYTDVQQLRRALSIEIVGGCYDQQQPPQVWLGTDQQLWIVEALAEVIIPFQQAITDKLWAAITGTDQSIAAAIKQHDEFVLRHRPQYVHYETLRIELNAFAEYYKQLQLQQQELLDRHLESIMNNSPKNSVVNVFPLCIRNE